MNPSIGFIDELVRGLPFEVSAVVWGCCAGVDEAGKNWGDWAGLRVIPFPPNWAKYGRKAAPPIRNGEMAKAGDALLLIWGGDSRGSADMKRKMLKLKKPIYELIFRTPEQVLAVESGNEKAAMKLPFSG